MVLKTLQNLYFWKPDPKPAPDVTPDTVPEIEPTISPVVPIPDIV